MRSRHEKKKNLKVKVVIHDIGLLKVSKKDFNTGLPDQEGGNSKYIYFCNQNFQLKPKDLD